MSNSQKIIKDVSLWDPSCHWKQEAHNNMRAELEEDGTVRLVSHQWIKEKKEQGYFNFRVIWHLATHEHDSNDFCIMADISEENIKIKREKRRLCDIKQKLDSLKEETELVEKEYNQLKDEIGIPIPPQKPIPTPNRVLKEGEHRR